MQKVFIVLLASLIGMLLCSGVALAGNCCVPVGEGTPCECMTFVIKAQCTAQGGMWMGTDGCNDVTNEPCKHYHGEGGKCVPEMSTIVLLATGLICMAGYFRLRRNLEE